MVPPQSMTGGATVTSGLSSLMRRRAVARSGYRSLSSTYIPISFSLFRHASIYSRL